MKQKTKRILLGAAWLALVAAFEARAQFGVQLVDDIQANISWGTQLGNMATELNNWTTELNNWITIMQPLGAGVPATFGGYTALYTQPQVNNLFGETGSLAFTLGGSLQSLGQVIAALNTISVPVQPTPPFVALGPGDPSWIALGSAELQQALAQNAILTSINTRANQLFTENGLQALQTVCLRDGTQTQEVQIDCSAAAGVLGAQQTQIANGVIASHLDLAVADAMDKANAKIAQVNEVAQEAMAIATRIDPTFSDAAMQNSVLIF